jgi:hypothetical protein
MKVIRERLEGTQVQRLVVIESGKSPHHGGECVGYLCPECMQADETLEQIWHDEDCSLATEHGRKHYDDLTPDSSGRPIPELQPGHQVTMVKYGKTEGRGGLHDGEVLSFICKCGNLDEDLFEIVHDETCSLAGQHGRGASQ